MIIWAMGRQLADLGAVKDIKVFVVFSRKLLTNLLQMLRTAVLNADFLCTTLSI